MIKTYTTAALIGRIGLGLRGLGEKGLAVATLQGAEGYNADSFWELLQELQTFQGITDAIGLE